jgi:hypothetical protein
MTMFSTARHWDGLSRSAVFRRVFNSRNVMTEKGKTIPRLFNGIWNTTMTFFVYRRNLSWVCYLTTLFELLRSYSVGNNEGIYIERNGEKKGEWKTQVGLPRRACPTVTLVTKNPTRNDLVSSSSLRVDRPATNCLNHDMTSCSDKKNVSSSCSKKATNYAVCLKILRTARKVYKYKLETLSLWLTAHQTWSRFY